MKGTEYTRGPVATKPETISAPRAQRIDSAALLGRGRELVIVHQNDEYRLRITKNGKLILTK